MKHLHIILTAAMLGIVLCSNAQKQFRLVNGNGMEAVVSDYGARLVSLTAHNWNGRLEPVIKGYADKEGYLTGLWVLRSSASARRMQKRCRGRPGSSSVLTISPFLYDM